MRGIFCSTALLLFCSAFAFAQNLNSSTTTARPRTTTNSNTQTAKPSPKPSPKPAATTTGTKPATTTGTKPATTTGTKPATTTGTKPATATGTKPATAAPAGDTVQAAFNRIIDGIKKANVDLVTQGYLNSPSLVLFNYNGSVTKGWEQMRMNRESSYPDIKDVKLEIRDKSIVMLGRDGAVVSCLWTQTQTYKGASDTASGRMTLVFKRVGTTWKAVHLHTSPDRADASRVPASEQTPPATTKP